jgi:hypothetical protein
MSCMENLYGINVKSTDKHPPKDIRTIADIFRAGSGLAESNLDTHLISDGDCRGNRGC